MKPTASIIIPTFNNPEYLNPCVESIAGTGVLDGLCELIIVNNGSQPLDYLNKWPQTQVLKPGENLGWERGLQYGLDQAQGDFICFQNDDTLIPKATQDFYSQLLWPFSNEKIAAVGPATTVAAGRHSIFQPQALRTLTDVTYLIFFTVMIRRRDLEAVGGIDTSAPGGDDLDLCMRLRKQGKSVVINPDAFLIHHAFKTGERVHGGPAVSGGWNSQEMTNRTNRWLIQKHGFKAFMETIRGFNYCHTELPDLEGQVVQSFVRGPKVVELGCGFRKTVPQAVGLDLALQGEMPSNLHDQKPSVADIRADVTHPLPLEPLSVDTLIARHILEHCVETIRVLRNWGKALKIGGRLIIAVPNQDTINSIPLNPEHVAAYTPRSLKDLMELLGWKIVDIVDPKNGVSFVACFEKVLHVESVDNGKVLETVYA